MNPPPNFGSFRVLHQIGSGVLGPVFRSFDSQLERLVVVKAFKLDLLPEQAAAFAEALRDIVARPVDDAGVVRAIDAGLEGVGPYLALEFVAEETLDTMLRDAKPLAAHQVVSLCGAIARAIDAAWDVGIGHGALHPRDVFVRSADAVAVTGFGVAQALQRVGVKSPLRRPCTAPERVAGSSWDARADVYSLGAIAQQLLAKGGAPSAEIGAVLEQALAEDPNDRFETARGFSDALAAAVAAAPESIASAAAVTTNAHRPVEIGITEERVDPVADALLHDQARLEAPVEAARIAAFDEPAAGMMLVRVPTEAMRPSFPWAALAAVAVAGLAVGSFAGYKAGLSKGTAEKIERAVTGAGGVDTPPVESAQPTEIVQVPNAPLIAPQAARTVSSGYLVVESSPPGALVFVDGRRAGQTPLRLPEVPLGTHNVLVARSGFEPLTQQVALSAADPSRTLQVRLRPGAEVTAPVSEGSLQVDSRPRGARVVVDGRAVGQTPLRVPAMSPGDHRVLIELIGHRRVTSTVKVMAGEQARLAVSLEQTSGSRR